MHRITPIVEIVVYGFKPFYHSLGSVSRHSEAILFAESVVRAD
jgi:hypothetical protein